MKYKAIKDNFFTIQSLNELQNVKSDLKGESVEIKEDSIVYIVNGKEIVINSPTYRFVKFKEYYKWWATEMI